MFVKNVVGLALGAAIVAGGLLAVAPIASASTPTRDDAIKCANEVGAPSMDLFYASWDSQAASPDKNDVLGHVAAARVSLAQIHCNDQLQAQIADGLGYLGGQLDAAVQNIGKGDWTAAKPQLREAEDVDGRLMVSFDKLIYG
jgi:hypothetical protein